jgi:hypothetical protein
LTDRQEQDYSRSSDVAVRESSGFKLKFYPKLNVRNIAAFSEESLKARKALASIYGKVLVVKLLTTKYKSFIHACHTEVKRNLACLTTGKSMLSCVPIFAVRIFAGAPQKKLCRAHYI